MKILTCFIAVLFIFYTTALAQQNNIFFEDFENGWGDWYADNGVWEIGKPSKAYSGQNVAGTALEGGSTYGADSRLISPPIVLPTAQSGERIQLKFYEFHDAYEEGDAGFVQVSVDGNDWQTVAGPFTNRSAVWSQYIADVTDYAGSEVFIAFLYTDFKSPVSNIGWYIDYIILEKTTKTFQGPEDFENGWGDWYADNGVWEIGKPSKAYSGQNVAGTALEGGSTYGADSRLISPPIVLPDGSTIRVAFQYIDFKSPVSNIGWRGGEKLYPG